MDYDWRGFLFLILALLIFVAIVLLIAGSVVLIRRAVNRLKTRNRRKDREWAEIAKRLRDESP